MQRKQGTLIPFEVRILETALDLVTSGTGAFHGYSLAKVMKGEEDQRLLTAHGTLYRALHRLEVAGLLESFWEDAHLGEKERRPRRRLYRVTGDAQAAVNRARAQERAALKQLRPALETP